MVFSHCSTLALAGLIALAGSAAEAAQLQAYHAPIAQSSISGVSSGAFMATQFGVAWSSVITGVGVVAGGPYYCARASRFGAAATGGAGPILTAVGPCMVGPPGDLAPLIEEADDNAARGAIDPTANLAQQKIYVFRGYNDSVVAASVTDAAAQFYRHYLGAAAGNLFQQTTLGAGHSFVVARQGEADLDGCADARSPYIDQCGYDQAGVILQHIYGALNPPVVGPLGGKLLTFDQSLYTGDDIPDAISLADQGYVYVPAACAAGAACRVHIALHGCEQQAAEIGERFVAEAGYNGWAESNRIIVLYPQTKSSSFLPFNPKGCWDWWGYKTFDDSYVTRSGKQIATLKRMLDALTAGAAAPPAAAEPFRLALNDRADTTVALAWTAAAGAQGYRVFRAAADGDFAAIADVAGLSFADSGLTPASAYRWQVAPVIAGAVQPPSNIIAATTRPTPPPCADPGSCPIVAAPSSGPRLNSN